MHMCVCVYECVCVFVIFLKSHLMSLCSTWVCVFCEWVKFVGTHLSLHYTMCVKCVCVRKFMCVCECVYFVDSSKVGGVWIFHTLHIHACIYWFVYIYRCAHAIYMCMCFTTICNSMAFHDTCFCCMFWILRAWMPWPDSCVGFQWASGSYPALASKSFGKVRRFLFCVLIPCVASENAVLICDPLCFLRLLHRAEPHWVCQPAIRCVRFGMFACVFALPFVVDAAWSFILINGRAHAHVCIVYASAVFSHPCCNGYALGIVCDICPCLR